MRAFCSSRLFSLQSKKDDRAHLVALAKAKSFSTVGVPLKSSSEHQGAAVLFPACLRLSVGYVVVGGRDQPRSAKEGITRIGNGWRMMSTTIDAVRTSRLVVARAVARQVASRWRAPGLIAVVVAGGALICWLYVAQVAKNLETPKAAAAMGSAPVSPVLKSDRGEAGTPATDLSPALAALKQSVEELAAGLGQVRQGLQEESDRNGKQSRQLAADLAQLQQSAQRDGEQGLPKRDLAALEQEGERIGRLNSVTSDVAQLKQALGSLAADLDKVRQALPQETDRSERKIAELATELMAAKQSAQRAHEESGRRDQELLADLAHLKEAFQGEIYRNEKVAGRSSVDVAQIKEALRHESEQRIQIAAELKAGLSQLKDALGEVTATLAAKQQGRQDGGMSEPLADRPTRELLASRAETDASGIAPSREEATVLPAAPAAQAPSAPAPPDDGDTALQRLMSRASLLLSQGDIGAARVVLERAAETGNARALFALAETFDPVVLSAWGTLGTRGDAARARELYAKALAGGVQEAQSRLTR